MSSIAVVGCGNLGSALVNAWKKDGIFAADDITIIARDALKVAVLRERFSCEVLEAPSEKIGERDVLLLSVKPQDFGNAATLIKEFVSPKQLIVSVMTGVKISDLENTFSGSQSIIRTMPNLPIKVGKGFTVVSYSAGLNDNLLQLGCSLFESVGKVFATKNEDILDIATAVSASGPGFIYFIIEQLIDITRELGCTDEEAHRMVIETIIGSAELLKESGETARSLRAQITSKAGTTAAGINVFENKGLGAVLKEGIRAAFNRALELRTLGK